MWVYYNCRRKLLETQTQQMLFLVYEVGSVMGGGEHGGTQRWQLTIIHLVSAKESCELNYIFYSFQNIKCVLYLHSTTKFKKGFYIYIIDNRMC